MTVTAFLSAVSDEFHNRTPGSRFVSYRDVLARSLRILVKDCQVVVQEDLKQGMGDLLETLETEIRRCHVVVHLVGEMAGAIPEPASLRRLKERHLNLLDHEPELKDSLGDATDVSYTQWEAYLAFQHGRDRLVFVVDDSVPRSPKFRCDEQQQASQRRHWERLQKTGEHYEPCFDQLDLARKAVASIERFGMRDSQQASPSRESVAAARELAPELVFDIGTALREAAKSAVSEYDPAGVAAYLAAIDTATLKRELDRRTGLQAIHEYRQELRDAATVEPTPKNLYDLALAEIAMGNYLEALLTADRLAAVQIQLMEAETDKYEQHREGAINAYLLSSEAAQLAGRREDAIAALERAGALVDVEREPVLWADLREPLAEYLLDHAQFDRAESLIDDIVDIREEHQREDDPALPKSLLVWCKLLYSRAKYQGVVGVSLRAAKLFNQISPLDLLGVATAFGDQALALIQLGRFYEAEPLIRRALSIAESYYGTEHPNLVRDLNNLALLLKATNRLEEAERLMRRVLSINESFCGADHPNLAIALNILFALLRTTNRLEEAEPLIRRALSIDESFYGAEHPRTATTLNNLAQLLRDTNRPDEAESLMRRALSIDELFYGAAHPSVAVGLNNLASLLRATNRMEEAEPMIRRALAINESSYGAEHPIVATTLNNLGQLLEDANQTNEAERMIRRALSIYESFYNADHPNVATSLNNLASLLRATNRPEEAEPLAWRVVEIFDAFRNTTGQEHLNRQVAWRNYQRLLQEMGLSEDEAKSKIQAKLKGDMQ